MRWKRRYSRGVECSPWPPAHHSGSWDQSSSVASHAPSSPRRCTGTEFARCASLIRNVVWVMPSGPRMCSAKYASSDWPLAASTTRPSQSVLMPYSYCVPGSATSGEAKIAFDPESTLGVPVASSQRTMSALKNQ